MSTLRLPDSYFEKVYAAGADPWGFATSPYERRKYDLTVATLPRPRYAHAFEPGCAIGVLSARLAERCTLLTCHELVPRIADVARERLRGIDGAHVAVGALPCDWPDGPFDLVVLSEVLYYLTLAGLDAAFARLDATLSPQGHVLAVHYRGETDYPLRGDEVHDALARHASARYVRLASHEEPLFRMDLYERRGS